MKPRRLCNIVLCLLLCAGAWAHNDSAHVAKPSIYCGTQIKLDIASPIVVPAVHKWQIQHYEVAANVRLAQRYYPTVELGYAGGHATKGDTVSYNGQGGFLRVGADINPLKKHPESPHALLIGLRLGTAVQGAKQGLTTDSWHPYSTRADVWGEIVAGCQVEIAQVNQTSFYMCWMGRFKCLFTRQKEGIAAADMWPIYIPGFGTRDNIGWGLNYYLGWRF